MIVVMLMFILAGSFGTSIALHAVGASWGSIALGYVAGGWGGLLLGGVLTLLLSAMKRLSRRRSLRQAPGFRGSTPTSEPGAPLWRKACSAQESRTGSPAGRHAEQT